MNEAEKIEIESAEMSEYICPDGSTEPVSIIDVNNLENLTFAQMLSLYQNPVEYIEQNNLNVDSVEFKIGDCYTKSFDSAPMFGVDYNQDDYNTIQIISNALESGVVGLEPFDDENQNGVFDEGENFSYGDDTYQEVAVFPSPNPNGNIVAFMHGGGWVNGYKEWVAFMAPALNQLGITFVSIGYRLAPKVMWPVGVKDIAKALKWIKDNINDHGGDSARLFIGGHSAGGHYASWLAVRDDWQESVGLAKEFIRGALPVSGVYDFIQGRDSMCTGGIC